MLIRARLGNIGCAAMERSVARFTRLTYGPKPLRRALRSTRIHAPNPHHRVVLAAFPLRFLPVNLPRPPPAWPHASLSQIPISQLLLQLATRLQAPEGIMHLKQLLGAREAGENKEEPAPSGTDIVLYSNVSGAVKEAKSGRIDFKIDKTAIVHVGLGKVNFSEEALRENIGAFVPALLVAKPVGLKKTSKYVGYVKNFSLCSTMGPGFPVSIQSLSAAADHYNKLQQGRLSQVEATMKKLYGKEKIVEVMHGFGAGIDEAPSTKEGESSKADEVETLVPKKKASSKRSVVWTHFEEIYDVQGVRKGKCLYCAREFYRGVKKHGTTSLHNHLNNCKKHLYSVETRQKQLSLQSSIGGDNMGVLSTWKFDQEYSRKCLSLMIVLDELPFKFVEREGFKKFVQSLNPKFKMPSRWTISRDCSQLYKDEKAKLKMFIRNNSQSICITTDTWTSVQNLNYMVVTAHFIDNDWKLNKKILSFCSISSHKGDAMASELEKVLKEWGIERVFSISGDNASSNQKMIDTLRKVFIVTGKIVASGKYMHVRCIAHIFNLVVQEGLNDVKTSVTKIRNAVKYVRSSPARLKKFTECVDSEGMEWSKSLVLDVSTRWNSTYLMLRIALNYERTFDAFESAEPYFRVEAESDDQGGVPSFIDWHLIKRMVNMLHQFYLATLRIFGSIYVTSNTYWTEISDLYVKLSDWKESDDVELRDIAMSMQSKFSKY
ncbi:zinc finger BED domain-containing protein RICESLEEPER 2-like [Canna indica]|uniref:Zinc finger BED domain-containing protein RICESLEEPER 2-like n=1 Tax=Canna indica TaxID=4628 RepID=A0AAQ3L531_9LILI|nr:zinc finger BED domain-containing protein RICESLEEPER 2-like [Canna indica]